jgi:hypothetical protein
MGRLALNLKLMNQRMPKVFFLAALFLHPRSSLKAQISSSHGQLARKLWQFCEYRILSQRPAKSLAAQASVNAAVEAIHEEAGVSYDRQDFGDDLFRTDERRIARQPF